MKLKNTNNFKAKTKHNHRITIMKTHINASSKKTEKIRSSCATCKSSQNSVHITLFIIFIIKLSSKYFKWQ